MAYDAESDADVALRLRAGSPEHPHISAYVAATGERIAGSRGPRIGGATAATLAAALNLPGVSTAGSGDSAAEVEDLLRDCHAVGKVETVHGAQVVTEPRIERRR